MSGSCEKCRVVINELLCFISSKLDVMDVVSLKQICASNFTDQEIDEAIALLNKLTNRRNLRKGEGKSQRHLLDIITILKETEPKDLPTFVAQNLNRLPPVSFDYIDVTTFLKDLLIIKQDIHLIKSTYTNEATTKELQRDISSLRHDFMDKLEPNISFVSEGSSTLNSTVVQCSQRSSSSPLPPPSPRSYSATVVSTVPRVGSSAGAVDSRAAGHMKEAAPPLPLAPVIIDHPTHRLIQRKQSENIDSRHSSADDFIIVNKKPKKPRNPIKNYQGKATNLTNKIKVAAKPPKLSYLYVTKLDKCTTAQDVKDFLSDAGETADVELLVPYKKTPFASFKITTTIDKYSTLCNENFWPVGIEYRGFSIE
ncbi:hypothetical protein O0L34_g19295 [Tuta absoluta]|nr:hypothetical protein O0L34_g19295 [Tuta absoluta]